MLLTLFVALLAGCWQIFVAAPYYREARKMAELDRMGVTYVCAPRAPPVFRRVFGDRWFQRITRVRREVCADDRRLLAVVERCRHLESLELFFARALHPKDFARLGGLRHLKNLALYGADFDDEGMVYVGHIVRLETLDLGLTSITDTGLTHVASLENLESLSLNGTAITDRGLIFLTSLERLETLSLRGTDVTDRGMKVVGSLPNLRRLKLRNTVRGISSIYSDPFPNTTQVSQECVTELKEKNPQLRVYR
jgi:hypothetical protein